MNRKSIASRNGRRLFSGLFAGVAAIAGLLPDGLRAERTIPLFWRTHVSPHGDRVALRVGD